MNQMTKGILLQAYDNEVMAYSKLAVMCAALIKKNMGDIPVCLCTNQETKDKLPPEYTDYIDIVQLSGAKSYSVRSYSHLGHGKYNNGNIVDSYDMSPFDETIYMDTDYMVFDDSLNNMWGSISELAFNTEANVVGKDTHYTDQYITRKGYPMCWATVTYFKKSERARLFFETAQHVRDNYPYYKARFFLPGKLYRSDFSYAIAMHLLSGQNAPYWYKTSLPWEKILMTYPKSETVAMSDKGAVIKSDDNKLFVIDQNIHCMDKPSLLDRYDDVMRSCK